MAQLLFIFGISTAAYAFFDGIFRVGVETDFGGR